MNILIQCAIIFGICVAGNVISTVTHLPVPGSVFGMAILFFLLYSGILKKSQIKRVSKFLLGNMAVFFIPSGVSILVYYKYIEKAVVPYLLIIVFSTFIVMGVTGRTAQLVQKLRAKSPDYYKKRRSYVFVAKQGDFLYYSRSAKAAPIFSGLYRTKLDGGGRRKLAGGVPFHIRVAGDYVYYGRRDDADGLYDLWRVRADGSGNSRVGGVRFRELVSDGKSVYCAGESGLCMVSGPENAGEPSILRLCPDRAGSLDWSDGYVYYVNCADGCICRAKCDGTGTERLGGRAEQLIVQEERIYFVGKKDGRIYRMKADGLSSPEPVETSNGLIEAGEKWLYHAGDTRLKVNDIEMSVALSRISPIAGHRRPADASGIGIMESGRCRLFYGGAKLSRPTA